MNGEARSGKRNRVRTLRYATMLGVVAVYLVGVLLNTGLGSPSAFGVGGIAAVCPLGALETALAGGAVLPLPLIALVVAAVLTVVFGKAFCGWVCPVPLVRKLVTNKEERDAHEKTRRRRAKMGRADASGNVPSEDGRTAGKREWPSLLRGSTTGLGVLGVTLATTLVFGFPVFCLVCPVGLVFATVFAVVRLVVYNELVVDLIVFPAIIVLELVVLRKWCSTLCPIGALLGLFSRFNRRFVPTVDEGRCLAKAQGSACDACHAACNYDIDLVRATGAGALHDCSKCRECAAACPAQAISFPRERRGG